MTANKKKYISPKLENYQPLAYSSNELELKLFPKEQLPTTQKSLAS
jgi:hypothetical protein